MEETGEKEGISSDSSSSGLYERQKRKLPYQHKHERHHSIKLSGRAAPKNLGMPIARSCTENVRE